MTEGNLIGVVLAIAQLSNLLLHVGLRELQLCTLTHLHIRVGIVDAAVDDGNHDPLAGVAAIFFLPQLHR